MRINGFLEAENITASSDAQGQTYQLQFSQVWQSDLYVAESNTAAEEAMRFGLDGYEVTARHVALLADLYAELADIYLRAERFNGRADA